jgi:hypothetical protein
MEATETIIKVLEDNLLPFTSKEVAVVAQDLGIEGDIRAISCEVLEEGVRRSMEAVRRVQEIFGKLPYPETVLEEHLRGEGWITVTFTRNELAMDSLPGMIDLGEEARLKDGNIFLGHNDAFFGNFHFYAWPGVPRVYLGNLYATTERVFFRGYEDGMKNALGNVRALRPLFASLKLTDIEEAIEALAGLKDGEARMEGNYVLARSWYTYTLRRGSVLGDPQLDGALLLGKNARLSFPGDVDITFKTEWDIDSARIDWAYIRLGEEGVLLHGGRTPITPLHKNPLASEIQRILVRELEERQGELSPKMLAFLKAFVRHEDPFKALAEERFHPHVTAEFFSDI